jgi:FixJ family two-component response regulator
MNYLTSKQIADRLGISERRVRELARSRGIGSQLPDKTWVFREIDLAKFQDRKPGRPKND